LINIPPKKDSNHAVLWSQNDQSFRIAAADEAIKAALSAYLMGTPHDAQIIGLFAEYVDALGFMAFLKERRSVTIEEIDLPFFGEEEL